MTATALLFPGQGTPPPWIAPEVVAQPAAAALIDVASAATGIDLGRALVRGDRALERTEVLQPALVAATLAVEVLLRERGVRAEVLAGHSLGELAAWAAGGGIARRDAIEIAALRGRLMAREAARRPGGMLALRDTPVAAALAIGRAAGAIVAAADHGAEQVVSGDHAAIGAVAAAFPGVRLPVAGPWHSPAMAGAVDELTLALRRLPRRTPRAELVVNRDGQPAGGRDLCELIAGQLVRPIRFADLLATLARRGVARVLCLGPGKALRGLCRRALGERVAVEVVDDLAAIDAAGGVR